MLTGASTSSKPRSTSNKALNAIIVNNMLKMRGIKNKNVNAVDNDVREALREINARGYLARAQSTPEYPDWINATDDGVMIPRARASEHHQSLLLAGTNEAAAKAISLAAARRTNTLRRSSPPWRTTAFGTSRCICARSGKGIRCDLNRDAGTSAWTRRSCGSARTPIVRRDTSW